MLYSGGYIRILHARKAAKRLARQCFTAADTILCEERASGGEVRSCYRVRTIRVYSIELVKMKQHRIFRLIAVALRRCYVRLFISVYRCNGRSHAV